MQSATMPAIEPNCRPWWHLDLPAILVVCLAVMVAEAILAVGYYRREMAKIEIGRAVAQYPESDETTPSPTRETPEN